MLFAQLLMKIFTQHLLRGKNTFCKNQKTFMALVSFFGNRNHQKLKIWLRLKFKIISHAMFVLRILQIEVGLGGHIRAQHGMQGTDQKASLTSKENGKTRKRIKTKKMLLARLHTSVRSMDSTVESLCSNPGEWDGEIGEEGSDWSS